MTRRSSGSSARRSSTLGILRCTGCSRRSDTQGGDTPGRCRWYRASNRTRHHTAPRCRKASASARGWVCSRSRNGYGSRSLHSHSRSRSRSNGYQRRRPRRPLGPVSSGRLERVAAGNLCAAGTVQRSARRVRLRRSRAPSSPSTAIRHSGSDRATRRRDRRGRSVRRWGPSSCRAETVRRAGAPPHGRRSWTMKTASWAAHQRRPPPARRVGNTHDDGRMRPSREGGRGGPASR